MGQGEQGEDQEGWDRQDEEGVRGNWTKGGKEAGARLQDSRFPWTSSRAQAKQISRARVVGRVPKIFLGVLRRSEELPSQAVVLSLQQRH